MSFKIYPKGTVNVVGIVYLVHHHPCLLLGTELIFSFRKPSPPYFQTTCAGGSTQF